MDHHMAAGWGHFLLSLRPLPVFSLRPFMKLLVRPSRLLVASVVPTSVFVTRLWFPGDSLSHSEGSFTTWLCLSPFFLHLSQRTV